VSVKWKLTIESSTEPRQRSETTPLSVGRANSFSIFLVPVLVRLAPFGLVNETKTGQSPRLAQLGRLADGSETRRLRRQPKR
jgi:hypothetical protein